MQVEHLFLRDDCNDVPSWFPTDRAKIHHVSARAFDKIAFGDRQEIVAVVVTPQRSLDEIKLGACPCIGVLEFVEKPGNVGAVLRSADGAGIDAVVIVDEGTDLFNPNTIRASLGTVFTQQAVSVTFEQYRDWAQQNSFLHFLAKSDGDVSYHAANYRSQPSAIVLGSESHGLTDRWTSLPHASIQLPMRGKADSLNVSVAASILFYEAMK